MSSTEILADHGRTLTVETDADGMRIIVVALPHPEKRETVRGRLPLSDDERDVLIAALGGQVVDE